MRTALIIAASVILSACSSGGTDKLVIAARDEILGRTPEPEQATPLTRAKIEATGLSLLRVSVPSTGQNMVAVASQLRDGNVTYVGPDQRTVVLRGGLVTVTHGLGQDMAAPGLDANDPIVRNRALSAWPASYRRSYRADQGRDLAGERLAVTCTAEIGPSTRIAIAELAQNVRKVTETCEDGEGLRFENTHMVAPATGFIWQSSQWTGREQGHLDYDVLEPLE